MERKIRSRERWIAISLLLIASSSLLFIVRREELGAPVDWTIPLLIATIALIGAGLITLYYRRKLSPTSRKALSVASRQLRGLPEFDIPTPFYFLMGVVANLLIRESNTFVWAAVMGLYVLGAGMVYLLYREKFGSPFFLMIFLFLISLTGVPFANFFIVRPDILTTLDLSSDTSVRLTLLFFLSNEIALGLGTVYVASYSWRSRLLIKNGLSAMSLEDSYGSALAKIETISDEEKKERVKDALSELRRLHDLFLQGNFSVTLSLGWTVLERCVESLAATPKPREAAKQIGFFSDSFDVVYKIRNKMTHGGYEPCYMDALNALLQVKRLLEFLSERAGATGSSA